MSSSNRKRKQRNLKIRITLAGAIIILALGVFIYAVRGVALYGLTEQTVLLGFGILILFLGTGCLISPVFAQMNKKKELATKH